jgi:hypothetical protein
MVAAGDKIVRRTPMNDKNRPSAIEQIRAIAASSPEAYHAVNQKLASLPSPTEQDIADREMHEWVKQLVYLIRRVAEGKGEYSENALFWVRLYGFFEDIRRLADPKKADCPQDLRDLLHDMLAVFSVDERLYLNYRRDKESHPRLSSWEIDAKSTQRWITDRAWTGREAQEAIARVLHKHSAIYETDVYTMPGLDESRIAVAMASKLVPKLERIGEVIDKIFGGWRNTRMLWCGP